LMKIHTHVASRSAICSKRRYLYSVYSTLTL
jgi:hypothetical protein